MSNQNTRKMLEKEFDKKVTCSINPDFRRPVKSGQFPVRLLVYSKPHRQYYKIGLHVTRKEWQRIQSQKLQDENLLEKRNAIIALLAKANKVISILGDSFTFEDFAFLLYKKDNNYTYQPEDRRRKPNVYDYYERKMEELMLEERIGSHQAYARSMSSFKRFKEPLRFDDVTVHFLRKYEKKMLSQEFSPNTIGIHIRHLRAIINIGVRKGIISEQQYPFGKMIHGKYEIPVQRKIPQSLDTDEVKRIIEYEVRDYEEDWAKDMWLFSFYCNGMNMVDIFNLQYSSVRGDFIYFIREKTKHTCRTIREIEIAVTPPIQNIIDKWGRKPQHKNKYIFEVFNSYMDATEKQEVRKMAIDTINRVMKRIAKKQGIKKRLSTSVARYCWATTLLREGMPMTYISKGLGHTSYNTTEKYLADFDQESKIEAGNLLMEVINEKDER